MPTKNLCIYGKYRKLSVKGTSPCCSQLKDTITRQTDEEPQFIFQFMQVCWVRLTLPGQVDVVAESGAAL